MSIEICKACKGVIYPFERAKTSSCLCVPIDYEQCSACGFDHEYEPREANHAHSLISWANSEPDSTAE